MTRTRLAVVLSTTLVMAAMLAISGPAAEAGSPEDVAEGNVDIWQLRCVHSQTHCVLAQVCDRNPSGTSVSVYWQVTIAAYSPSSLIGVGDMSSAFLAAGTCGPAAQVCRPGTNKGPMKALASVTHVDASGRDNYEMFMDCKDVNGASLPFTTRKLTIKTDQ